MYRWYRQNTNKFQIYDFISVTTILMNEQVPIEHTNKKLTSVKAPKTQFLQTINKFHFDI